MDSGHSLAFLCAAPATGLVGLVTLPATPTGHRPPAQWKKYQVTLTTQFSVPTNQNGGLEHSDERP
jgi:hypothetical protein